MSKSKFKAGVSVMPPDTIISGPRDNIMCQLLIARRYVGAESSDVLRILTGWDFILMATPYSQSHAKTDIDTIM